MANVEPSGRGARTRTHRHTAHDIVAAAAANSTAAGDTMVITDGGTGTYNLSGATTSIIVSVQGVGTLDEFFDIITLIQTKKITRNIPIVLFGKNFWEGLIDWERLVEHKVISRSDLDLFVILDTVDETFEYLKKNMDMK